MQSNPLPFLRRNWFKLLCIGLLIYIFFQKDLSFQINMSAPGAPSAPPVTSHAPEEQMTDAQPGTASASANLFDRLTLPSFGNPTEVYLRDKLKAISTDDKMAYLRRFAQVAISERKKYGIPSSIILASALLHSTAGKSNAATTANNHFNLAADPTWSGPVKSISGLKLRSYDNAWSSFRDHSQYLATFDFGSAALPRSDNYQAWAALLDRHHISTEPKLEETLLEIISTFQLYELDSK
ncbi:MAG: glucosaminidase domain-containing protein [Saprospiraceae bacterium]|nr:glucosaminidase domain-containing protein [Saprospiraceae bacterium]